MMQGIGVEAVTVRGTLERRRRRLVSTPEAAGVHGARQRRDGVLVRRYRRFEPAGEPLRGWIGFRSPGISTRDEVEIALSSAASYSVLGDYVIVLDSLCTGEPDALFVASVASHLPMFVSGILVLIAGLILLLIASVGYLIGVPKETGGLDSPSTCSSVAFGYSSVSITSRCSSRSCVHHHGELAGARRWRCCSCRSSLRAPRIPAQVGHAAAGGVVPDAGSVHRLRLAGVARCTRRTSSSSRCSS
ncbi:MAG: hypothetical protein ACLTMP_00645 [Eggerthella lenta]